MLHYVLKRYRSFRCQCTELRRLIVLGNIGKHSTKKPGAAHTQRDNHMLNTQAYTYFQTN
jgi:hypothetical protein